MNDGRVNRQRFFFGAFRGGPKVTSYNWAVLSDEQMSKRWPFSLLNNEQMSNWLGVEHQPDK